MDGWNGIDEYLYIGIVIVFYSSIKYRKERKMLGLGLDKKKKCWMEWMVSKKVRERERERVGWKKVLFDE